MWKLFVVVFPLLVKASGIPVGAGNPKIELLEMKMWGAPESKTYDDEKFFLIQKESILPDIYSSDNKKFEQILGSFEKPRPSNIVEAEISKFPNLGIKTGDVIQFYNTQTNKIEAKTISKKMNFILLENPVDGPYYLRFNIALIDSRLLQTFNHMDVGKFESVAYRGNRFKLRPSINKFTTKSNSEKSNKEIDELLKEYKYQKKIPATDKAPNINRYILGDKEIIGFDFASSSEEICFYKIGTNKYLSWLNPRMADEIKGGVIFYADFIKGAEFVALYEAVEKVYLRIVYKDRIENYKVWDLRGGYLD